MDRLRRIIPSVCNVMGAHQGTVLAGHATHKAAARALMRWVSIVITKVKIYIAVCLFRGSGKGQAKGNSRPGWGQTESVESRS